MRHKIFLASIAWSLCAIAGWAQNGPDNDPDGARGYVDNIFHHSQEDSINLYNGQLTIPIAIGPSYPIGPRLKFQATLTYTSSVWEYGNPGPNNQSSVGLYLPIKADQALGVGWSFTLGAIKPCGIVQNSVCYVSPDGAEHLFDFSQTGFARTNDASQFYLHSLGTAGYEMWDGEGNHYVFGWPVTGFDDLPQDFVHDMGRGRNGWYLTSLSDPFGNGFSATYFSGLGTQTPCWTTYCPIPFNSWIVATVSRIADSRTLLNVSLSPEPIGSMIKNFDFAVFAGGVSTTARWSLTRGTATVTRTEPNTTSLTLLTIAALSLPAPATQYSFTYNSGSSDNSWGGLLRTMTLPTGGVVSYVWGSYSFYHGRTASISMNCAPLGPPHDADTRQSGRAAPGQTTNFPDVPPAPSIPGTDCTPTNPDRWLDVQIGVIRRTETVDGQDSVTDYAQYAFPFGERGTSPADSVGAQTLTLVTHPVDGDGLRRATATLFWGARKGAAGSGDYGDRSGADMRIAIYDHDPYPGLILPFPQPLCGGTADALCVTNSVRVVQRVFDYDSPTGEIGHRRLLAETTFYGSTAADGSCPGCKYHGYNMALSGHTWEENGRHYNIEQHSGNLGNDDRTVTTTWVASVSPWLPNLFNRRRETQGSSTVDHYFEFTPSNGFFRGDFLHDTSRQIVFLTCRYEDGAGSVGQDFSATYERWPGWPAPPPSNACSQLYPAYPTVAVGVNGDAFGKTYTHRNGQLLSARWMANPTTPADWFLKNIFREAGTGWITFSADPSGLTTGYSYDGLGRVTGIFPPSDAPTIVSYDSPTQTTATRNTGTGLFTLERYLYDGLGRTSREVRLMPAGSASPYAVRRTQYDGAAHTSFVSEWAGCPSQADCASSAPAAGTRSSNFDPLGRPQIIRNADGATTTISYADVSSQVSDTQKTVTVGNINGVCSSGCSGGISAATAYRYDAFGRLTSVTEPGGVDVTSYAYDANGKLTQVSQGVQTRTFSYDSAGFLRSETTPEKGAVSYDTYGSLGNLLSEMEPGSLAVSRTYDFAGRLTGVTSGGLRYLTNCYDGRDCADGNPGYSGGLYPGGKLTRRIAFNSQAPSTPTVTDDLTFSDPAGRLSGQTTSVTGGSNLTTTQQWQFNGLGLVAHHSHPRPGGATPFVVSTDYDAGLPRTQYLNGLPMITGITHQASGALASYTTGIGIGHDVTTTIAQDASLLPRPSRISARAEGSPSPAFDTLGYGYDGAGNIVAMGPDGFGYDARSRLISASLAGIGSQGFSYDRYGNLLSKGGVSYSVSPSTNRILTANYDLRGNLTGNGGETYDYDGLDRQIRHTASPDAWNYIFDGADERLVKIPPASGTWTYTLRDESKRIVSEFSGASQSRDNIFLGNLLVASCANGSVGGNDRVWTFYTSDHLATPRLVTDITAAPVETPRNWPFGENATPAGLFQRIRFAAMERDAEASRYHDHARNHDFNLGRFLTPDARAGSPTYPLSWNRYAYAVANPLRVVDPDGKEPTVFQDAAAKVQPVADAAALVAQYLSDAPAGLGAGSAQLAGLVNLAARTLNLGTTTGEAIGSGGDAFTLTIAISADVQTALEAFVVLAGSARSVGVGETPTVYRGWGGEGPGFAPGEPGAGPYGRSWSTTDPRSVSNYRDIAGLPDQNTGRFVSEGKLVNREGVVTRSAAPLNGNKGGVKELVVPDPQKQIKLTRVVGMNPPL